MRKTKNLREMKKEKSREDILYAARILFSQDTFHNVSVDDIAEKAMLSKSTLYNYYSGGKDEIYFMLGKQAFEMANDRLKTAIASESKGLDQFLSLCKFMFETINIMPIVYEILAEFYTRVNNENLAIEEMHDEIATAYQTGQLSQILEQFDQPYLIEFYIQLQQTAFLWLEVIENGKNDGSITCEIDTEQIVHFVNLTITGIIHQSSLRKSSLKRVGLETENIFEHSIKLIRVFLTS